MSRPSDACVWACPVVHVWAARAHLSLSGLTPVCRQRHRATYRAPRRALLEPHPQPRTITTLSPPLPCSPHPAYQLPLAVSLDLSVSVSALYLYLSHVRSSQVKSLHASEHKLAMDLNGAGFKPDAIRVLRRVKVLQEEINSFSAAE